MSLCKRATCLVARVPKISLAEEQRNREVSQHLSHLQCWAFGFATKRDALACEDIMYARRATLGKFNFGVGPQYLVARTTELISEQRPAKPRHGYNREPAF